MLQLKSKSSTTHQEKLAATETSNSWLVFVLALVKYDFSSKDLL